jgi:hypothetical protein
MRKKRANLFFAGLIVFLFVQFAFIQLVAEPYPAIVFPGFGDVPDKDGVISFGDAQLWAYNSQGDSAQVNINKDFPAVPLTYQTMMMRELTEYAKNSHKKNFSFNVGNQRFSGSLLRRVGPRKKQEFKSWIAQNVGWGEDQLEGVAIHWYNHSKDLLHDEESVSLKKFKLEL